jgi:alkylation response protein AidB-like acyl-CoA dehydrogenase
MDFELSPEQRALRERIERLAQTEFAPRAAELDRTSEFPWVNLRRLAEEGFIGINIPVELGGGGEGVVAHTICTEEIARACAATAVIYEVHNSICTESIVRFGTPDQKARYAAKLARLEWLGGFALTEPAAGSDPASQQAKAVREGDCYVLNGEKTFITSGGQAHLYVVTAMTDRAAGGRGISAFLVEKDTPGLSYCAPFHKMGLGASHTTSLVLDNLRVPAANRLGAEGEGLKIALTLLDYGRIGIAAQSLGIARAAFDAAVAFAKERVQFGKPIATYQAIQWKLAEMAMAIDAARLLTYRAAWLKDRGERGTREAATAKLFASRAANQVVNLAQEVFGGRGYMADHPIERLVREARVTEIYEGTSEVMKMVIASSLLR